VSAAYVAGYQSGFEAGRASRDEEFEALERVADYWYFRANNPGLKTTEQKIIDSIISGMEANEERRKKYAELDEAERVLFQRARDLIEIGVSDVDVAREVGLFLPIVENLRTGVL
jgi:hypothetical protein